MYTETIQNKSIATDVRKYGIDNFADLEGRYASAESYIQKISAGSIRSLILNGPPGVGKTYSVESYLKQYAKAKHKVVAGHMTTLSLYVSLYQHREEGSVLVLDDIDSVLSKIEGVNILKAAMDTKPARKINWESSSGLLTALKVPTSFEFRGSVILISNIGFGGGRNKLSAHLDALKDRSFSICIADNTKDSLFKQVCFMVIKKNLLKDFNLSESSQHEVLDYIYENLEGLNKVSLRTAVKLAQLMKADPDNWKCMANNGLLDDLS
ncbi:ATP-binding protein [Polynucleobacter sinensis]|uniref:ATP-binding protein n=1 Tax=Polynucleobacter sinensis TaxID=1743157 RepID=UPI0007850808|nr:ATP-binding protein [Polynucleobacter sinensis]